MRIGIDASCWANGRGYGRFTRELLPRMVRAAPGDQFLCLLDDWTAARFDLRAPNLRVVAVRQTAPPTRAASAHSHRRVGDMLRLTVAVRRERPDVFFFPSVYTFFPLPPGQPAVVTVHDTIAERFPHLTFGSRRARAFWNAKVRLALRQARLVATVSQYSAREIEEVLRVPPDRIRVIGEAPADAYRPSEVAEVQRAAAQLGLPADARWFVYVGGFNPHKRVDAIVRAHARVARPPAANPPHLLLVGPHDQDVFHRVGDALRQAVREAGSDQLVHWTGYVPDELLRHLLSGAVALLLPSANEGFGLPAVEAAACGTPVVATTASPLPDLLDGGGIFVAPGDDDAVAAAMRLLLSDEDARRALGARARECAARLTWEQSAARALAALREAAQ